jgi:hypothetical protein
MYCYVAEVAEPPKLLRTSIRIGFCLNLDDRVN